MLPFNGELVEVPGLYVCTPCAGAIMVGDKECTVTPEQAVTFLTDIYVSKLAYAMTVAQNDLVMAYNRFKDVKKAAETLKPGLEVGLGVVDMDALLGDDEN
jgi:hypothetical protein